MTEKRRAKGYFSNYTCRRDGSLCRPFRRRKNHAGQCHIKIFDPKSGSVSIGGVDVKDISKEELMNTVSFVFQNSRLVKDSVLENVRMGKQDATREEVMDALEKAQCMDIIEKLPQGVDTVIGTKGVYLSGGEQQRIAIARVMLKIRR